MGVIYMEHLASKVLRSLWFITMGYLYGAPCQQSAQVATAMGVAGMTQTAGARSSMHTREEFPEALTLGGEVPVDAPESEGSK